MRAAGDLPFLSASAAAATATTLSTTNTSISKPCGRPEANPDRRVMAKYKLSAQSPHSSAFHPDKLSAWGVTPPDDTSGLFPLSGPCGRWQMWLKVDVVTSLTPFFLPLPVGGLTRGNKCIAPLDVLTPASCDSETWWTVSKWTEAC